MKRIVIFLMTMFLIIPTMRVNAVAYDPEISYESLDARFWEDEAPPIGFYINASSRYLLETVTAPRMGSTYGEWSVMDLLRGMYTGYDYMNYIPDNYFHDYLTRINGYVVAKEGNLDRNKSTEWSRLTLSMSALGKDIRKIGEAGRYIKTVSATKQNDKWLIESNNLSSLSSIKIANNKITVHHPVGVQTPQGDYALLEEGEYTVNINGNDITLVNGQKSIKVAATELVQLDKPYNFVERMSQSHRFSYRQGINGPIWVIIAMNTGQYELIDEQTLRANGIEIANGDTVNTVGKMIDYILAREITTSNGNVGGWALSGNIPDADITGMALQAFAPYYLDEKKFIATNSTASFEEFKKAVERGILTLKRLQRANGGYDSWGTINAESVVQVIVALTAMQMDPLGEIYLPTIKQNVSFTTEGAFVDGVWTNNMIDALLTFFANGSGSSPEVGGFKHVTTGYDGGGGSGTSVNAMATDQALYGLIAYDRFKKGEKPLYDMTDMMNGEYKKMSAKQFTVTFVDGSNKTTKKVSPYAVITMPESAKAWNTNDDLLGTRYMAKEKLIMPEHNIILYADHDPDENDPAAVKKVTTMINDLLAIPNLSKDYKNQIDRVIAAYKKLPTKAQAKVPNYAKLLELESKVNNELAQYDDELKVTNLIQTIDSLLKVPTINRDYEIAITNARVAYNQLSAKKRKTITNRYALDELDAALAVAIEMEQGKEVTVTSTKAAIDALPTIENVTLEDAATIFKIQAYLKQLTPQQQSTLSTKHLEGLIVKLRVLQDEALDTEQLEDELNDDTYGKLTVIGNTLHVTAPRTTGTFQVRIDVKTLKESLKTQVNQVIFSDVRGIQLILSKEVLMKQLTNNTGELILQVSQLDYSKQQFHVQWRLSTGETLISPNYMKLTIPYSYFINGKNLPTAQLVKVLEQPTATSYISTKQAVTINMLAGATYQFVHNDIKFSDTQKSSSVEDLTYLANRLVVRGKTEGLFAPNDSITRAEFAVMINRVLGLEAKKGSVFKDVSNEWFAKDVRALNEVGIIKGNTTTTFNPNGKLTREQAAMIMVRILDLVDYSTHELATGSAYLDHGKISGVAQPSVYILKNLGVMSGYNGYFSPQNPLTRIQMAIILKRTFAVAELL